VEGDEGMGREMKDGLEGRVGGGERGGNGRGRIGGERRGTEAV